MPTSPEIMLLSSIVRDADFNTAVAASVNETMFHTHRDEWVWLSRYYNRYKKTPSRAAFMHQFPDFRMKSANDVAHFAEEVRIAHARSQLTTGLRDVAELIADGDTSGAVALLQNTAVKISADMSSTNDINLLSDWEELYKEAEERQRRYEEYGSAGIPTGWESFDDRAGGIAPGQLGIVAARLGELKSWTLMRMATTALMNGHKVHYASLEMSRAEVGMRVHNMISGSVGKQVFQSSDLMRGNNFDLHEYKRFLRSLNKEVKEGQFTVSDTRNIGIAEIAAHIERYKPDIYFLDYLTLARMSGDGNWKDIGDFTKQLKDLSGSYGVAIWAAAQLNRQGVGKEPGGAETLAGSDQIGQDADMIISQKKVAGGVVKMSLTKYRHGSAGYGWWAHLNTERGTYGEVSKAEADVLIERERELEDLAATKPKADKPVVKPLAKKVTK